MNGKGFAALVALLAAALLGVATAAYANDGAPKEPARTDVTTVRTESPCTMEHKCANPACKEAGYGTDDCYTPASTGGTTTTTESPCTMEHKCANPACKEAGYGTDDCYTPVATVTPPAEVGGSSGATETPPAAVPTPVATPTPSAPAVTPATPSAPTVTPSTAPTQGVAGAHVQSKSTPARGGVLGTTHTVAAVTKAQTLPFTGLSLWQIALAGGLMVLGGAALMRLHRDGR
jgi:hypothetical protein